MFVRNGQLFDITQPHVIGDVQYPVGWFYDVSNQEAAGVTPLDLANAPTPGPGQTVTIVGCEEQAGRWVAVWSVQSKPADVLAQEFAAFKQRLVTALDNLVLAVYQKPITLAREYQAREEEAQAYKDAGYSGDVGPYLQTFADNAGMTVHAATDLILKQAIAFRTAEPELAELRMRKYAIQLATTEAEAVAVYNQASNAVKEIAATL